MMKFAFRVIFTRPPFSKWLPTKSSNCQWSPISMKIDIQEYFEVRNWLVMMKLASTCPKSNMGVVWRLLCLHPNTIKPSYYYYSSSSTSRRDFVRPNSQRLIIRSLLIFTGRWISISRGAFRSWKFQNGRRCHGKCERVSKSFTSLISETAKGISTRLGIYIKQGWQNILTKKIASE